MAKKAAPPVRIRHFRADGVTQFTEIPDEPEVLDFLRSVFESVARAKAARRRQEATA